MKKGLLIGIVVIGSVSIGLGVYYGAFHKNTITKQKDAVTNQIVPLFKKLTQEKTQQNLGTINSELTEIYKKLNLFCFPFIESSNSPLYIKNIREIAYFNTFETPKSTVNDEQIAHANSQIDVNLGRYHIQPTQLIIECWSIKDEG